MNLYTYDLDSLVDMSSKVVEGTIIVQHRQNNFDVWEIQISNTLFGGHEAGQIIDVTALDFFRVSDNHGRNSKKLQKGDALFLFLDRAKATFLYDIPINAEIYWPVPSGVRFISGEKAVEFWQEMNPGPYEADITTAETNRDVPTVAELRRQIHESIRRVESWNQFLKKKASHEDIPALLDLLRERNTSKKDFRGRDCIVEAVCKQLVDLKEPPALLEAARIGGDMTLGRGVATPDGRRQLIAKVADKYGELLSDRLKWAGLLAEATSITGPTAFYESVEDEKKHLPNEHYLKSITELATNEQTDKSLQAELFSGMRELAGVGSSEELIITDDGKDAQSMLESFWKRTRSEELKYNAEIILFELNRTGTNSGFGPIVSLLKLVNYYPGKLLWYDLEYLIYQKGDWTAKIVVKNLKTGKETTFDLPSNQHISGNSEGGCANGITLPADFPSGHYRVFAEFFDGEKVVATSHYFETDL